MSENYKTIKELADELGVSKTYIEKIIRVVNIHSELLKKKNRFFLNIKQQEIIKNYLDKPPTQAPTADKEPPTQAPTADKEPPTQAPTADKEPPTQAPTADKEPPTQAPTADKEPPTQAPTADVVFLQNELVKRGVEIDKLHELLDQQQRLALQDKKLLEEYKSEINELKALKMPREDMKDGSSIRGEAQEEIERLKAKLKLSEEERNKAKEKEPVKTESKKWWHFGRM
ncbi:replication-associated protein RepX [Lactococcus lactis]|uniref:replication-associated protein RepX n=1 Tax=Lactococcus lactis TaxID=1358 RepID=UPI0028916C4D|nr:replication-associated protein RepX [Lactococcus lactis]MDT2933529.1 replication-associated protein RepX [Lactococcus lactis]